MKLSTKAALYSGLVFPGAGYFIIKKITHGTVSCLMSLAGLTVVVIEVFHKAQAISEKIITGAMPVDIGLIREQILTIPGTFPPEIVSSISIMIGLIWLVGIVDSWRIAEGMMKSERKLF